MVSFFLFINKHIPDGSSDKKSKEPSFLSKINVFLFAFPIQ